MVTTGPVGKDVQDGETSVLVLLVLRRPAGLSPVESRGFGATVAKQTLRTSQQ